MKAPPARHRGPESTSARSVIGLTAEWHCSHASSFWKFWSLTSTKHHANIPPEEGGFENGIARGLANSPSAPAPLTAKPKTPKRDPPTTPKDPSGHSRDLPGPKRTHSGHQKDTLFSPRPNHPKTDNPSKRRNFMHHTPTNQPSTPFFSRAPMPMQRNATSTSALSHPSPGFGQISDQRSLDRRR